MTEKDKGHFILDIYQVYYDISANQLNIKELAEGILKIILQWLLLTIKFSSKFLKRCFISFWAMFGK